MVKQVESDTKNKKLFCFDLDNVFMYSNTHNELNRRFILPHITNDNQLVINGIPKKGKINTNYNKIGVINALSQLLNDSKTGLKHPKQTVEVLKQLLDRGHEVAVTTFNKYPEAGFLILEQFKKLGLTSEQIKKINIISGFPALGPKDKNGKNEHIKEAMRLSCVSNPENVVLIDDTILNLRAAKRAGYITVQVFLGLNSNLKYLDDIRELSSLDYKYQKNSDNIESLITLEESSTKNRVRNIKSIDYIWKSFAKKFFKIGILFSRQKNHDNMPLEENSNVDT